jgi:hypothetical protein
MMVFVPKVYALDYDLKFRVDNTLVTEGSVKDIKVAFGKISETVSSSATCSFEVKFDNGISLNREISGANGWNVSKDEEKYIFTTSDSFLSNAEMAIISVKINSTGNVYLSNIECADGFVKSKADDKKLRFNLISDEGEPIIEIDTSAANLSEIVLSEGTINFKPEVTEYTVTVSDFEKLNVSATASDVRSVIKIDKSADVDKNTFMIEVTAHDGTQKNYVINVIEDKNLGNSDGDEKKFNFTLLFIIILVLLVVLNVVRIILKRKKK